METKTWQETVLNDHEVDIPGEDEGAIDIESYLAEQAKITGDIAFKAGELSGMRKVVEWLRLNTISSFDDRGGKLLAFEVDDWQAFLKECFKDNPEVLKKLGVE